MTNVDVAALAAELSRLLDGARVDKAYQPAKDRVLIRFRQRGLGRLDLLFELGRFVTVTKRAIDNPDRPSMVAKILRQKYGNARVVGVSQVGFDRLMRIDLERDARRSIVLELFGEGNMLLLDEGGTIFLPMRGEDYGARKLRQGEAYQAPPGGARPFDLDVDALREAAGRGRGKDVVRFLAMDLGFGGQWAEELCARAGLDKKAAPKELDDGAWGALHAAVAELGADIARNDLAPALVYEDGELTDAVPFTMETLRPPKHVYEEAPTFREALDAFFVGIETGEDEDDPRRARFEEAKGKLERQVKQMEDAIAGFQEEEDARRADGEALYARFQEVQKVLDDLQAARQARSWQEIEATLRHARESGDAAAQVVRELRPHNGTAVLRVEDTEGRVRDVEVSLNASVQENADACYQAAKKGKARQEGASKALRDARARLDDLVRKGLDAFGEPRKKVARQKRHFWYESYRWTFTPGGLIAVGGRNAGQNDQVVKKYLRDGDRYVHADIHGAPSVVVRPVDAPPTDVGEDDLRVAGQFAVCSSRAWRQFGAASAYWVTPQQVDKTPRTGEFVPRGAWIVHGKRNSLEGLPVAWAVGMVRIGPDGVPVPAGQDAPERSVEKLAGGPPDGIRPFAESLLEMEPGDVEPNDAAVRLAERFGVDVEDAQAVLPPGPVRWSG